MTEFAPMESLVTPFMLENGQVRGRLVRLGGVSATILARYGYPPFVRRMLGELVTVAAMLSTNLKQEGIITLQVRGKGLVTLMVADAAYGGELRAYAEVPPEAEAALNAMTDYSPTALVGEGAYLAITLDAGGGGGRYQGIVGLEGDSVAAALANYFTHSEQRDVEVKLAVSDTAPWITGGFLIERMPPAGGDAVGNEEAWAYARAIAATVSAAELTDLLLDAQTLLYRLFHEEGVIVYPAQPMTIGCRCSRARIQGLLMSMDANDRADMVEGGAASVHCHFCNKAERFTPSELGLTVI